MGIGQLSSGIMGNRRAKDAAKETRRMNRRLEAAMNQSAQNYRGRAPMVQDAYQSAGQKIAGLYEPSVQMLSDMSGGMYAPDLAGAAKSTPIQDALSQQKPAMAPPPPPKMPMPWENPDDPMQGRTPFEVANSVDPKKSEAARAAIAEQDRAMAAWQAEVDRINGANSTNMNWGK